MGITERQKQKHKISYTIRTLKHLGQRVAHANFKFEKNGVFYKT